MKNTRTRILTTLVLSSVSAMACSAFDAPEPRPKCRTPYEHYSNDCEPEDDGVGGTIAVGTGGTPSCENLATFEPSEFQAWPRDTVDRFFAWRSRVEIDAAAASDEFALAADAFTGRELELLEAHGVRGLVEHFSSPLRVWHNGFANRFDVSGDGSRDRLVEVYLRPEALVLHVEPGRVFVSARDGGEPPQGFELERVGVVVLELTSGVEDCDVADESTPLPYRTMLVGNPEWIEGWEAETPELVRQRSIWAGVIGTFGSTLDSRARYTAPSFPSAVACYWFTRELEPEGGCRGTEDYLDVLAWPTLSYAPSATAMRSLALALDLDGFVEPRVWSADAAAGGAGGASFD